MHSGICTDGEPILLYDWLRERARWSYLAHSGFLAWSCKIKDHFWCFKSYNKFFIDQACLVKMAGYWPRSFLCVYGPRRRQTRKKRTWPISSHLDRTSLVNNPYIFFHHACEAKTVTLSQKKQFFFPYPLGVLSGIINCLLGVLACTVHVHVHVVSLRFYWHIHVQCCILGPSDLFYSP